MVRNLIVASACSVAVLLASAGCKSEPKTEAQKTAMTSKAHGTVDAFKAVDSSFADVLNRAAGYAVFPNVGKAGLIIGASHGNGEVYEGGRLIGYAGLTQGTLGAQIGAQTFDEVIVFMSKEKLDEFKQGKFSLTADASAVAIKSGAAAKSDASKGVLVFTRSTGGLMAEATVGGQKFNFQPL